MGENYKMSTNLVYGKNGCKTEFYFVSGCPDVPEIDNTVTIGLKLKEYISFTPKKIVNLFKSYYLHDITLVSDNGSLFPEFSIEPESILYFVYLPKKPVK